MTKEQREFIDSMIGDAKDLSAEDRQFLEGVLLGELTGVPDRFSGAAIVNVSKPTPEQQKVIDEWNAQHGATQRDGDKT